MIVNSLTRAGTRSFRLGKTDAPGDRKKIAISTFNESWLVAQTLNDKRSRADMGLSTASRGMPHFSARSNARHMARMELLSMEPTLEMCVSSTVRNCISLATLAREDFEA